MTVHAKVVASLPMRRSVVQPLHSLTRWISFSLLASGPLLASGCLISPPQELEEAEPGPPQMFLEQADPPLSRPVECPSIGCPPFSVPFVADNLGERLTAKLYVNYGFDQQDEVDQSPVTSKQTVELEWSNPPFNDPGCYIVTMLISYEDNFDSDGIDDPVDWTMAATATWYVVLGDKLEINFGDCPSRPAAPE